MLEWLVANLAQLAPFMLLFAAFIIACVSFVGSIVGDRKKDAYGVEDSRSQRADPVIETKEEDDFQHDPQNMSVKPTTADHAQENTTEDAYAQRDEEALYEQVAEEMAAHQVKKGLWAKAFAQCEGDLNRTKALYIKLRVEALQNEAGLNKVQQQPSHAAYTEDTGSQRIGLAASDDRQDQSNTFLVSDTHPWRRFFARMVDTWTTYFVPGFALGFVLGDFNLPAFLLLLIGVVMSLFIEAGLISLFGATPAKWLFGIRVVHPDGSLLTFDDALNRSFLVFVQGLGFCIPFIAPFTQLFAYRRLTKTGTTSWDASSNAVVHHEKLDLLQTLVCIVAVLVALMIHGYAMNLMVANLAKDVMNEMNRKGQSMQRKYGQSEEPATSSASNVESKKTSLQNANEGAGDDAELAAIKKQVGWATLLPTRNVQARKTGYNRRTATPDRGHLARPLCVQGGGALSRAT